MVKNSLLDQVAARRRAWARGAVAVALTGALALTGCAGGNYSDDAAVAGDDAQKQDTSATDSGAEAVDWDALIDIDGMDFGYSDRDKDASYDAASATTIALAGDGATVTGEGATADGSTVTISAAGTYVVSGELADGEVVVNASDQDKVQVVLAGASIRNADGAALNIQQADKVFVTLAEGSQNTLADGADYALAEGEDEPNAALFSKVDLTINGTGALTVEGNCRHGVNSKDDLVVTGGAIAVTAKEDGLRGKDCVKIADGKFTGTAGEDGIRSSNDEDPTRGFVAIDGGTFALEVQDDGIQAATYLRIAGGEGTVTAADHAFRSEVEAAMTGGDFTVEAGGKGMNPETRFTMDGGTLNVTGCDEGIETEKVIVNDGALNIVASDDGINAAVAERSDETEGTVEATAADGETGGDTAAGGEQDTPGDGVGEPPALPEGMEEGQMPESPTGADGQRPQPPMGENGAMPELPEGFDSASGERPELPEGVEEGQVPEPPADMADGQQPQGAPDGGMGGGAGGPMAANASEDCLIQINGGKVTIDAGGDGLDSNGYVEINGGTVLVNGSAGGGDSALDYEYGATVTGGTVILAGSAGMAETFTEGTQPFALVAVSGAAGDTLAIADASGATIAECTVPKAFQCVVVSSPNFTEGGTYQAIVNGAATEFTASTTPTNTVGGMGDRGMGGPGGGRDPRDQRPDSAE